MPEIGFVKGVITLLTLLTFLGICWWAFRPSSRRRFEKDAMIPFEDHERARDSSRDGEESEEKNPS
ncbi:MAG: cbb3-type cytochrome oxidase subunit 3 [bacterium]